MSSPARVLSAGDRAPAFHLRDQHGERHRLSEHRGRKVLVFFYPKAGTPGCTTQACGLRDVATEVGDTVILGISPDLPDKLESFDTSHSLGFTLLSDPDHTTAEKYGVWGEKKLYGRSHMGIVRSAFLLDERGTVLQAWYGISPKDTPKKLLAALAA